MCSVHTQPSGKALHRVSVESISELPRFFVVAPSRSNADSYGAARNQRLARCESVVFLWGDWETGGTQLVVGKSSGLPAGSSAEGQLRKAADVDWRVGSLGANTARKCAP
jgi:hypothetical protein